MPHNTTARSGTRPQSTDTRRKPRRSNIEHEGPQHGAGALVYVRRHLCGARLHTIRLSPNGCANPSLTLRQHASATGCCKRQPRPLTIDRPPPHESPGWPCFRCRTGMRRHLRELPFAREGQLTRPRAFRGCGRARCGCGIRATQVSAETRAQTCSRNLQVSGQVRPLPVLPSLHSRRHGTPGRRPRRPPSRSRRVPRWWRRARLS